MTRVTLLIAFVSMGAGCNYHKASDILAFYKPHQVYVTASDYKIVPPDEIVVHCTKVPEIHEQRQQVRQDGKVSFEIVGEIEVAGKTPMEAAQLIHDRVKDFYNLVGDYPIEVRVVDSRSKYYFVYGEVGVPGPKRYNGHDTALFAINQASPRVTGWVDRIRIIRPAERKEDKPKVFEFDLNRVLRKGDSQQNILLQPGDLVYVQPTILAAIGRMIAEFVAPIGQAMSPAIQAQRLGTGSGY
jgi:polysaccharide export outer membrane protein